VLHRLVESTGQNPQNLYNEMHGCDEVLRLRDADRDEYRRFIREALRIRSRSQTHCNRTVDTRAFRWRGVSSKAGRGK
jgi:hypothetical protein